MPICSFYYTVVVGFLVVGFLVVGFLVVGFLVVGFLVGASDGVLLSRRARPSWTHSSVMYVEDGDCE